MTVSEAETFARASQAWQQGRPDAAAQLLQALVEQQPGHATALNTLGLIAIGQRDTEKALA